MSILPRSRSLALVAVAALGLALPAVAGAAPKPPKKAVVLRLLNERYADMAKSNVPAIEKLKVTVGKFRFGRTRLGDSYKDGVPANTRTWVFPVKLQKAQWTACNSNFTYSQVYTGGDFVFFRDDFGDWTYRGMDDKTTNVPMTSCPL